MYNSNNTSVDTVPSNDQNQTISLSVVGAVATSDYGVQLGSLTSNDVNVNQAISLPFKLTYIGNTPGLSNKLSVVIPTGLRYNYLTNNGFSCAASVSGQTCSRTISGAEWASSSSPGGLTVNLNLKADSSFIAPPSRIITASLGPISGNSNVDITSANNTASITLNLTNLQSCSNSAVITSSPLCNVCPVGQILILSTDIGNIGGKICVIPTLGTLKPASTTALNYMTATTVLPSIGLSNSTIPDNTQAVLTIQSISVGVPNIDIAGTITNGVFVATQNLQTFPTLANKGQIIATLKIPSNLLVTPLSMTISFSPEATQYRLRSPLVRLF